AQALAAPTRAAHDTAAALTRTVLTDPGLRECGYGAWAGRPMAKVAAAEPELFARWLSDPAAAPPGGEPLSGLLERAQHWLADRIGTPATTLAVVPPALLRALVVVALELPAARFWRLDAAPLGVSRLTVQNGRWRLAGFNATL
ncbi:histidine phosphatase family protein, partial [Lichenihabitans sp. Uapishka_5]|uniref:histidine phosphatase family protein n=1 Tax=Lichenihabitans sp. Uapishka_5 TaxID=3037302 RepID=UPI0029E7D258